LDAKCMLSPADGSREGGLPSISLGSRARNEGMDKLEILDRLRRNERALRERGVAHAALFGSAARGEQRPDSDIDILIEIAPDARVGVFQYVGIVQYLEDMFPARVDVANREGLKSLVRPNAERDAIYAF
jgi:predicted nucleotidyltransferase